MPGIQKDFGSGGSSLTPGSDGPNAVDHLIALNRERVGEIDWKGPIAVSGNTVIIDKAGMVFAVHALVGNTVGPKALLAEGAPATLQATVTYDATGVATIVFNGTDAITSIKILHLRMGKDLQDE